MEQRAPFILLDAKSLLDGWRERSLATASEPVTSRRRPLVAWGHNDGVAPVATFDGASRFHIASVRIDASPLVVWDASVFSDPRPTCVVIQARQQQGAPLALDIGVVSRDEQRSIYVSTAQSTATPASGDVTAAISLPRLQTTWTSICIDVAAVVDSAWPDWTYPHQLRVTRVSVSGRVDVRLIGLANAHSAPAAWPFPPSVAAHAQCILIAPEAAAIQVDDSFDGALPDIDAASPSQNGFVGTAATHGPAPPFARDVPVMGDAATATPQLQVVETTTPDAARLDAVIGRDSRGNASIMSPALDSPRFEASFGARRSPAAIHRVRGALHLLRSSRSQLHDDRSAAPASSASPNSRQGSAESASQFSPMSAAGGYAGDAHTGTLASESSAHGTNLNLDRRPLHVHPPFGVEGTPLERLEHGLGTVAALDWRHAAGSVTDAARAEEDSAIASVVEDSDGVRATTPPASRGANADPRAAWAPRKLRPNAAARFQEDVDGFVVAKRLDFEDGNDHAWHSPTAATTSFDPAMALRVDVADEGATFERASHTSRRHDVASSTKTLRPNGAGSARRPANLTRQHAATSRLATVSPRTPRQFAVSRSSASPASSPAASPKSAFQRSSRSDGASLRTSSKQRSGTVDEAGGGASASTAFSRRRTQQSPRREELAPVDAAPASPPAPDAASPWLDSVAVRSEHIGSRLDRALSLAVASPPSPVAGSRSDHLPSETTLAARAELAAGRGIVRRLMQLHQEERGHPDAAAPRGAR